MLRSTYWGGKETRGEFDTTGCRYPKKRLQRANPTDSHVLDTVKPVGTHGGVSTGGGLGGLGLSLLGEAREGAGCLCTGGRSPGPLRAALPKFRTLMLDEGVSGPQEERYATQEVPQGFRKVKGAGSPRRRGPALTLATARPAKRPKAGPGQAARSPGFSEGALSRGSSGPGLQAADRSGQKVPPRDSAALGHSTQLMLGSAPLRAITVVLVTRKGEEKEGWPEGRGAEWGGQNPRPEARLPGHTAVPPHPNVLLFADGEVRVQVHDLWRPIHGCGVPGDLKDRHRRLKGRPLVSTTCPASMSCYFPKYPAGRL